MLRFPRRIVLPVISLTVTIILLAIAAYFIFQKGDGQGTSAIGGAFSLTAQDGRTVTEKDLLGGPSIVFFGFTHCPDICPTALYDIGQIYSALGADGDKLKVFFMTVDPERDTQELLKTYLSSFDPRITGLTGSTDSIAQTMKVYRAYARKVPLENGNYTMDHTALVYLMDAQGRFVSSLHFDRPPADIAKEIRGYF
jgi:protein SCO1/2